MFERGTERPVRSGKISTLRDVHVDHLAALIHGPEHVPPGAGDLDIALVDEPTTTDGVAARPGCIDHQ
jgi:hypothetical protein